MLQPKLENTGHRGRLRESVFKSVKLAVQILVAFAFSGFLVWFLFPEDTFQHVTDSLLTADIFLVILCCVLIICTRFIGGWRLANVVDEEGHYRFVHYQITVIHNFLNAILPARIGEISLVVMLRAQSQVPVLSGIGVLIGLKVLDLLIVIAFGGIGAWLALPSDGELGWVRGPALVAGGVATLGFFLLPGIIVTFSDFTRRLHLSRPGKLYAVLSQVTASFAGMSRDTRRRVQGITLFNWLLLLAAFYAGTASVSTDVTIDSLLFLIGTSSFALALPVNGIAQIGPFETVWTYAATATGMSYTDGLLSAIVVHGALIATSAVQAATAFLYHRRDAGPTRPAKLLEGKQNSHRE